MWQFGLQTKHKLTMLANQCGQLLECETRRDFAGVWNS